jgi:adenosylcobinamide-phosphate synthase
MSLSLSLPLALAATIVEALIGYPAPLYRAIGHPVTWMGRWLKWLEARLNRAEASFAARRAVGVLALCLYLAPVALVAWAATSLCASGGALGFAALALLAASLPSQRSLARHVSAVAAGLDAGLGEGRRAVAMIVGRNPDVLEEAGVARAAIESLAENFSDGVVAPILWTALGGLVGGALYKAINTADSMIGHKDDRHAAFGWAAARLDDLVNLPASRLAALWLVLAAALTPEASARDAARAVWRDASHHRSPNAGWPEAAMAGALGLKLAGPRVYGETLVDDAFMGEGRREADAADIRRALRLYGRACMIEAVAVAAVAAAVWGLGGRIAERAPFPSPF